jgi:hypothetical protein
VVSVSSPADSNNEPGSGARYAAWFHDLDAWTEYWDIYHPETKGRFYFGDGEAEPGLLTLFLPSQAGRPRAFKAWSGLALSRGRNDRLDRFHQELRVAEVAAAIIEVDGLLRNLFTQHFGSARAPHVQADYLMAMERFGRNTLPPATERASRIAADDRRKQSAGFHTIEGDLMWFCWAMHLEASQFLCDSDGNDRLEDDARRALMMAGIAVGCPANFVTRNHRRTRPEYRNDDETSERLHQLGLLYAQEFISGAQEVRALYRIREVGSA